MDETEILTETPTETVETVAVPDRPFLTTNFEDYTVTEGLLLTIGLALFVAFLIRIVKGGFSWLL